MTQNVAKLPSANEFSPNIVDLKETLQIVSDNSDSKENIVEAIRHKYFSEHAASKKDPEQRKKQQYKLAANVCIGLVTFGLLDANEPQLTDFGKHLLSIEDNQERYDAFAKHIFNNACGAEIITAIRNLQQRGDKPAKNTIARELNNMGVVSFQSKEIPLNTKNHLVVILWLKQAKIFPEKKGSYDINEQRLEEVCGLSTPLMDGIRALPPTQRAFLRTLKLHSAVAGEEKVLASTILKNCEVQHGQIFQKTDNLAKSLFAPLADAGWIEKDEKKEGRGGKSGFIAATKQLIEVDNGLLGLGEFDLIPPEIRNKLNTNLEKLYEDLKSEDKHIKGVALEVLACRISIELGLLPVGFRERGVHTAGAEVDLIAEGTHLHFSRWLIQCKNTASKVGLSALAKEIGMAMLMNAQVVVVVTTSNFSSAVEEHARGLAATTALQAILVDGNVLEEYKKHGVSVLLSHFSKNAEHIRDIKAVQRTASE